MDFASLVSQMTQHAHTIRSLTRGISTEQSRWKPNADGWSILEVINHLYDEERQDFRVRLDIILHRPEEPFPPISPQLWVTERAYNMRDLETSMNNFLAERDNSLSWLNGLESTNWEASVSAPWGGELKAGDMFAAWVAHDVLHLRQLVELHYELVKADAHPYDVGYAGDW
jgi:hypothetical protein